MKSRLKITGYVICLLSVFLLVGYISLYTGRYTVIDLGGAIDNIGKQTPHLQEEACRETLGDTQIATSDYHYQVWEKDDMFYVQLPLAYLPADETVFLHCSGY